MSAVSVVGGGLAGCEAAWQLANAGIQVRLFEMRPQRTTPVHRSADLAELVCSNSFRGDRPLNAVGLLKREMELLDSLIIASARCAAVPAGGALAVDRARFSAAVSAAVTSHPDIELVRQEVVDLPAGEAIIATGPLTSPALHEALDRLLAEEPLAFFDAVAPIVIADSLDHDQLFRASRYDLGGGDDYLNAPMDRALYDRFMHELLHAERVPLRDFEALPAPYFEGCLPIEVMAERGHDTLRFGPMKPVGLEDPRSGRRPWAVVQLRQDDAAAEQWNLVGFQTKLTQAEQKRVFRLIPGLADARFARFGMIHRNTFVNAPRHLDSSLRLKKCPSLRLAGQITGVEGYVESAASGLLAGRFLAMEKAGLPIEPPPADTALGGLLRHLQLSSPDHFQPANITWGLIACPAELHGVRSRRQRRELHGAHALDAIRRWSAASVSMVTPPK